MLSGCREALLPCCYRFDQGLHPQDIDHSLEIVGEHVQADFGPDTGQRPGKQMGRTHPGLERTEDVFNGPAANSRGVRCVRQASQHALNNMLVFPARNPSIDTRRTLRLH